MKDLNEKLSYESDGEMGENEEKKEKDSKKEDPMFFNITQNSE